MQARKYIPRIPFFRIFYSTTYTSLFIIEIVLLAITPASLLYEAIKQSAYQYVIIIGGVYVLTAITTIFIYSSRLFSNRTVLAGVGKTWIPVEEGEVRNKVRHLIKSSLERSNLIALECAPRNLDEARGLDEGNEVGRLVKTDVRHPPWGMIRHSGWSNPDPTQTTLTPDVEFLQVVKELPNLLEARVVSLGGPTRAGSGVTGGGTSVLKDLRDYIADVEEVLVVPDEADEFITQYERARFSGRPLTETEFKALSASFAALLSGLQGASDPAHSSTTADRNTHGQETGSMSAMSLGNGYSAPHRAYGRPSTDNGSEIHYATTFARSTTRLNRAMTATTTADDVSSFVSSDSSLRSVSSIIMRASRSP